MSGPELAKLVRQRRPDIKFLFTSGYVAKPCRWVCHSHQGWRVDQVARAVGLR